MLSGDRLEPIHIAGAAVELGGHEEARAGRDGGGDGLGVDQVI